MEFNLDSNKVVRGAGQGVPIPSNATVAVDSKGRVYAIETGPAPGGQPGKAHVLDAKLEETGTISLGECPVGLGRRADSAGVKRRGGRAGGVYISMHGPGHHPGDRPVGASLQ